MRHVLPALVFGLALLFSGAAAQAQGPDWSPPSKQMPMMPQAAELGGDWLSPRAGWFRGLEQISGASASRLRAVGEPRAGSDRAQVVHFNDGPVPAVVWADRNGDGRADVVELYRGGGVIIQLLDVDYDGSANVKRIYNASGGLLREERM